MPRATSIYNLFLPRIEVVLDGKFFVSQSFWKPISKWSDRIEIKEMGIESYSIFFIDCILCCAGIGAGAVQTSKRVYKVVIVL